MPIRLVIFGNYAPFAAGCLAAMKDQAVTYRRALTVVKWFVKTVLTRPKDSMRSGGGIWREIRMRHRAASGGQRMIESPYKSMRSLKKTSGYEGLAANIIGQALNDMATVNGKLCNRLDFLSAWRFPYTDFGRYLGEYFDLPDDYPIQFINRLEPEEKKRIKRRLLNELERTHGSFEKAWESFSLYTGAGRRAGGND